MKLLKTNLGEVAKNIIQPIEISTPYPKLNELTRGLHRKELTLIAGRSSMGKTSLMLDIALHTSKEVNTGIFSLEMPTNQLIERGIASEQRVSYTSLKEGKIKVEDKTLESLSNHLLYINDDTGLTPVDIAKVIEQSSVKFEIIFIDYLQLIRSFGRGQRYEEIDKTTQSIREIAKAYNIAIVLLSQLNRDIEKRDDHRPRLSDLRESGGIEQIADTIIFIYRPGYYLGTDDSEGHLIIKKQRNGPLGDIPVVFLNESMSFKAPNFTVESF